MRIRNVARFVGGLGAAIVAVLMVTVAPAAAAGQATLSLTTSTIDPGASVAVTGSMWQMGGTVTITIGVPGTQTVVSRTTATASPNAQLSATLPGPTSGGDYEVCASGNDVQSASTSVCKPLVVRNPVTSTTTNTVPGGSGTTSAPTTTAATATTTPSAAPTLTPVDVVTLEPDGESVVGDPDGTSVTSGSRALQVGLVVGIVALTGIGVAGLLSSRLANRPRPAGAVAVGVVGALLAGAVAVGTRPDTVNVPSLGLVRVQSTVTLRSGAGPVTHRATCPSGLKVVSGGYNTTWASLNVDVMRLVDWVDTVSDPSGPRYVKDRLFTTRNSGGRSAVSDDWWDYSRTDGMLFVSDSIIDRRQVKAKSAVLNGAGYPTQYIAQVPNLIPAFRDAFLMDHDVSQDYTGVKVTTSTPEEAAWRVTAELPAVSLVESTELAVTALCAPVANASDQPGVLGVRLVTDGDDRAIGCSRTEFLTGIGWTNAERVPRNLEIVDSARNVVASPTLVGSSRLVAVCVSSTEIDVSTASASSSAIAGRDATASASCPSGKVAIGGSFTTRNDEARQAVVLGSAPSGPKSWTIRERSIQWGLPPTVTTSSEVPLEIRYVAMPAIHETQADLDTTTVTATAICARRVP